MNKDGHPIDELELMAYLDGELPRERASAAAVHLEVCRECQAIADDLRGVSREVGAWEAPVSDSPIGPQVLIALDEHIRKQQDAPRKRRGWYTYSRTRRAWTLGIGVAVMVTLVILIGTPSYMMTKRVADRASVAEREYMRASQQSAPVGRYYDSNRPGSSSAARSQNQINGYVADDYASRVEPSGSRGLLPEANRSTRRDLAIPTGPMVIRTAELTLIALDFEQGRGKLEEILKRHNGYLGQLTVSGAADSARTLTAMLRVPADKLDAAIAELKKLGRVESESQKGDEVSQQYVDLQARLTNARNTEQRLTEILRTRTGKLSDVLAVEQEISTVREEIERMEAQKKSLEKQVAFSTVNLKVTEDYKPQVHVVPDSTSRRIRNAAVDGYETLVAGLINVLLFLVSWGPSLLVWGAILFFPARMMWKSWRKKNVI